MDWPGLELNTYQATGQITIATAASTGVKGSYVEILATTTKKIKKLHIVAINAGSSVNFKVDIAVGAAASEVIVIPDIQFLGANIATVGLLTLFPMNLVLNCDLDAGVRLAGRAANMDSASAYNINFIFFMEEGD